MLPAADSPEPGDEQQRLAAIDAAMAQAQALVRRFVPAERSLVGELLADRRLEVTREERADHYDRTTSSPDG